MDWVYVAWDRDGRGVLVSHYSDKFAWTIKEGNLLNSWETLPPL